MDLDLWDCFGRKKLRLITEEIRYLELQLLWQLLVPLIGFLPYIKSWSLHASMNSGKPARAKVTVGRGMIPLAWSCNITLVLATSQITNICTLG